MSSRTKLQLFQEQSVRTHWDDEQEKWWFSIIDVVAVLTSQKDHQGARNYWKVLKHRLLKEGNETVTNCNRLRSKMNLNKKSFDKINILHNDKGHELFNLYIR